MNDGTELNGHCHDVRAERTEVFRCCRGVPAPETSETIFGIRHDVPALRSVAALASSGKFRSAFEMPGRGDCDNRRAASVEDVFGVVVLPSFSILLAAGND